MDACRDIIFLPGDLFHREEMHSSNCAFFVTEHDSGFRTHTLAYWTDVTILSDNLPPPTVFCWVMSDHNYHHMVLVSQSWTEFWVRICQIWLLPVVVRDSCLEEPFT